MRAITLTIQKYPCFHNYLLRRSLSTARTKSEWKSVIGLEIHAQLSSDSKLFSSSSTNFQSSVNENVNLLDAAIPGTLPVLNKKCVEFAVSVAQALSCNINSKSWFDRKHYFYSDLPCGYQITQQTKPLATNGVVNYCIFNPSVHKEPYFKSSHIKQIQMEQDSGKSLHDHNTNTSLIDLNRAGVPLIELVFEPDINDGEEAAALIKELTLIFERTNTCSCKMEEGALRVDANISVNRIGEPLGVRTEVKNIGSIRGVANAITYEVQRQVTVLEQGGIVHNETRAWDAVSKQTVPMRDKEEKQDYRFMPEPNLPPLQLVLTEDDVGSTSPWSIDVRHVIKNVPVTPDEDRKLLIDKYGLSKLYAFNLVNMDQLLNYFYDMVKDDNGRNPKKVVELLFIHLLAVVKNLNISVEECCKHISSTDMTVIYDLLQDLIINPQIAKLIIETKLTGDQRSPQQLIKDNNWFQINDPQHIDQLCEEVMGRKQDVVLLYKRGKTKVFSALVNDVKKSTQGKINVRLLEDRLKQLLQK